MREIERAFAFAAAIETVPGTDATPTMAANAIRLARPFDIGTEWVTSNVVDGEQTGGKGGAPSSPRSGRVHVFPIARRLRGRGVPYAAGTLPVEHALMKAILGTHNVTTTAGSEAVTYSGADEGESTLTVIGQTARKQFRGLCAVPRSARISMDAGGHLLLETELVSIGEAPTQQLLEAAVLDNVVAPLFKGAEFTLGGVTLRPFNFGLDFGLSVSEPLLDGTAGDAHAGYVLTDRLPTGTMQVHVQDLGVWDPFALAASAAQLPFVGVFGQTQYNRIRIEAARMEILNVRPTTRAGVKVYDLEYRINRAIAPSVADPLIIWN